MRRRTYLEGDDEQGPWLVASVPELWTSPDEDVLSKKLGVEDGRRTHATHQGME